VGSAQLALPAGSSTPASNERSIVKRTSGFRQHDARAKSTADVHGQNLLTIDDLATNTNVSKKRTREPDDVKKMSPGSRSVFAPAETSSKQRNPLASYAPLAAPVQVIRVPEFRLPDDPGLTTKARDELQMSHGDWETSIGFASGSADGNIDSSACYSRPCYQCGLMNIPKFMTQKVVNLLSEPGAFQTMETAGYFSSPIQFAHERYNYFQYVRPDTYPNIPAGHTVELNLSSASQPDLETHLKQWVNLRFCTEMIEDYWDNVIHKTFPWTCKTPLDQRLSENILWEPIFGPDSLIEDAFFTDDELGGIYYEFTERVAKKSQKMPDFLREIPLIIYERYLGTHTPLCLREGDFNNAKAKGFVAQLFKLGDPASLGDHIYNMLERIPRQTLNDRVELVKLWLRGPADFPPKHLIRATIAFYRDLYQYLMGKTVMIGGLITQMCGQLPETQVVQEVGRLSEFLTQPDYIQNHLRPIDEAISTLNFVHQSRTSNAFNSLASVGIAENESARAFKTTLRPAYIGPDMDPNARALLLKSGQLPPDVDRDVKELFLKSLFCAPNPRGPNFFGLSNNNACPSLDILHPWCGQCKTMLFSQQRYQQHVNTMRDIDDAIGPLENCIRKERLSPAEEEDINNPNRESVLGQAIWMLNRFDYLMQHFYPSPERHLKMEPLAAPQPDLKQLKRLIVNSAFNIDVDDDQFQRWCAITPDGDGAYLVQLSLGQIVRVINGTIQGETDQFQLKMINSENQLEDLNQNVFPKNAVDGATFESHVSQVYLRETPWLFYGRPAWESHVVKTAEIVLPVYYDQTRPPWARPWAVWEDGSASCWNADTYMMPKPPVGIATPLFGPIQTGKIGADTNNPKWVIPTFDRFAAYAPSAHRLSGEPPQLRMNDSNVVSALVKSSYFIHRLYCLDSSWKKTGGELVTQKITGFFNLPVLLHLPTWMDVDLMGPFSLFPKSQVFVIRPHNDRSLLDQNVKDMSTKDIFGHLDRWLERGTLVPFDQVEIETDSEASYVLDTNLETSQLYFEEDFGILISSNPFVRVQMDNGRRSTMTLPWPMICSTALLQSSDDHAGGRRMLLYIQALLHSGLIAWVESKIGRVEWPRRTSKTFNPPGVSSAWDLKKSVWSIFPSDRPTGCLGQVLESYRTLPFNLVQIVMEFQFLRRRVDSGSVRSVATAKRFEHYLVDLITRQPVAVLRAEPMGTSTALIDLNEQRTQEVALSVREARWTDFTKRILLHFIGDMLWNHDFRGVDDENVKGAYLGPTFFRAAVAWLLAEFDYGYQYLTGNGVERTMALARIEQSNALTRIHANFKSNDIRAPIFTDLSEIVPN